MTFSQIFSWAYPNWFFYSFYCVILLQYVDSIKRQKRVTQLEFEKFEKEKELAKEKELSSQLIIQGQKTMLNKLKAQINPHFLFNSLNFFYSEVRPLHKKAADSILLLSDILRYSLIEQKNSTFADLDDEIEHLQNYIELHRNRFHDSFFLDFIVDRDPDAGNLQIPPMILLTLVENCFKYGDLRDPAVPCTVKITADQDEFRFESINKVQPHNTDITSTGHGLDNIRNRLELIYKKGNSRFEIDITDNKFTCILTITLN